MSKKSVRNLDRNLLKTEKKKVDGESVDFYKNSTYVRVVRVVYRSLGGGRDMPIFSDSLGDLPRTYAEGRMLCWFLISFGVASVALALLKFMGHG